MATGTSDTARFHNTNRIVRSDDDPLYLQSSDHLGMILITTPLHEKNYLQWRIALETALGAKLKLGFIHGHVPMPAETDMDYNQWIRVDRMVKSWILNVISSEIASGFWYAPTAHTLWLDLQEQFGESNGPMLYKSQRDISSLMQGSLSVTMYYTALKKLWHEYRMLEPIPPCTCGASRHIADLEIRNQLIQFLMGLHDSYDAIRDQILLLDPVPSVAKAYSMILRVEKQRDNSLHLTDMMEHSVNLTHSTSHAIKSTGSTKQREKGDKFCTYCKESNHNKDQCFKLNGYPDWWKGKRKGKKSAKQHLAANVAVTDTPLEWSDSETDHEPKLPNTPAELSTLIQQEVTRALKGKSPVLSNVPTKQQQVNFIHTGEFAGPTE